MTDVATALHDIVVNTMTIPAFGTQYDIACLLCQCAGEIPETERMIAGYFVPNWQAKIIATQCNYLMAETISEGIG